MILTHAAANLQIQSRESEGGKGPLWTHTQHRSWGCGLCAYPPEASPQVPAERRPSHLRQRQLGPIARHGGRGAGQAQLPLQGSQAGAILGTRNPGTMWEGVECKGSGALGGLLPGAFLNTPKSVWRGLGALRVSQYQPLNSSRGRLGYLPELNGSRKDFMSYLKCFGT